ncbi:S41 family peptidase [Salimicrobium halophilum]|uniref:Carboxyl-terminal processing protease n=1 Tax=Salimicrobium halophilum TaxID=86666 RepID=A0A1G8S0S7_9BACI|nr:S41 family peptidase [Salimicrobium halophilum]SDJ22828.1 carboxyl-terminal processing protease [Salimicrobium halophilum]
MLKSRIPLILLCILFLIPSTLSAQTEQDAKQFISENYVEEISPELLDRPLEEILQNLDRYSRYLTKKELEQVYNSIDQELQGIGITLKNRIIQEVLPESPASEKGLKPGDEIIEVNDIELTTETPEELITMLKGEKGTTVSLTLKRNGDTYSTTLIRKTLTLPSVTFHRLAGNIGHLRIHTFSRTLAQEISSIVTEEEVEHWLIDIRNNAGGYVRTARQIAGFFPQVENAVQIRNHSTTELLSSLPQKETFEESSSLLINGGSASASEIMAGFYKDYEVGPLYGSTTYGKGLMQRPYYLDNEDGFLLSTHYIESPYGKRFNNTGIEPDHVTYLPLIDSHYEALETVTDYRPFPEMNQVSPDKTFEILLNKQADVISLTNHTTLFQLGGEEVEFDLSASSENEHAYELTPSLLVPGSEYTLVIEEGWTSSDGDQAQQGVIKRFNVK